MDGIPVYQRFLERAEAAQGEGDRQGALQLFVLALDFAPAERAAAVLYAVEAIRSAGVVRDPGAGEIIGVPTPNFPATPPEVTRSLPDPCRNAPDSSGSSSGPVPAEAGRRDRGSHRTLLLLGGLGMSAYCAAMLPLSWEMPPRFDPIWRAEQAIVGGDLEKAIALLEAATPDPEDRSRRDLALARAYARRGDRARAERAWLGAASADRSGGDMALEAGDALSRAGSHAEAADAYLFAISPDRTPAELMRIADAQERAGHPQRAARVRAQRNGS